MKSEVVEADYESALALFNEKFTPIANELRAARAQTLLPQISKDLSIILEREQVDELVELFKNTPGVNVFSAPQIMTGDGGHGRVSVEHQMSLPTGETIPLGLSIDLLPKITPDRGAVSLGIKATHTEFLHWDESDQPIPKLRTWEATWDSVLRSGQMLILARSSSTDAGELEPKLKIFCFRSRVMRPNGEAFVSEELRASTGSSDVVP
jgi:hypothetical protein